MLQKEEEEERSYASSVESTNLFGYLELALDDFSSFVLSFVTFFPKLQSAQPRIYTSLLTMEK